MVQMVKNPKKSAMFKKIYSKGNFIKPKLPVQNIGFKPEKQAKS